MLPRYHLDRSGTGPAGRCIRTEILRVASATQMLLHYGLVWKFSYSPRERNGWHHKPDRYEISIEKLISLPWNIFHPGLFLSFLGHIGRGTKLKQRIDYGSHYAAEQFILYLRLCVLTGYVLLRYRGWRLRYNNHSKHDASREMPSSDVHRYVYGMERAVYRKYTWNVDIFHLKGEFSLNLF